MRVLTLVVLAGCLATAAVASADPDNVVDCAKRSLQRAVDRADPNETIRFTGMCAGPVVISRNGITLEGVGSATIESPGAAAVTVNGASRVSLTGFDARNSLNGIVAINGAHVQMANVNAHDNIVFGISLQTGSSGALSDVTATHNGVHGLDVETGSAVAVSGGLTTSFNGVFGINVNGSSLTLAQAHVTANNNALGIQIATAANAFINDSVSSITANNNLSTGLTVVSGAHLVSFGGTITASGNPVNGVSVNSKGGLDLDAGSVLTTSTNGDGLVVQENSVMTVFNTPQFSGVPGFSTVNAHNNTGTGVRIGNGATLTLVNQAKLLSMSNGGNGLAADDGVGITLVNSTLTGNTVKDLQLTFGTRADFRTLTVGTFSCDATVLVRGTSSVNCPH